MSYTRSTLKTRSLACVHWQGRSKLFTNPKNMQLILNKARSIGYLCWLRALFRLPGRRAGKSTPLALRHVPWFKSHRSKSGVLSRTSTNALTRSVPCLYPQLLLKVHKDLVTLNTVTWQQVAPQICHKLPRRYFLYIEWNGKTKYWISNHYEGLIPALQPPIRVYICVDVGQVNPQLYQDEMKSYRSIKKINYDCYTFT
jgi:hypothetical protein